MTQRQINPLPKQHIAWEAFKNNYTTDILYGGSAGGGKSYTACQIATVCAYELPGASLGLARKELTTLMKTTYLTLLEVFEDLDIPRGDWQHRGNPYNDILFKNGSRIFLLDTSYKPSDPNYDRFGGLLLTHCFGEELPEWDEKAWSILKTRVGRNNKFTINDKEIEVVGKSFGTCNPTQNWVKRMYYDPYKKDQMPEHMMFIPAFASENTYLTASYMKNLDNIEDEVTRKRLRDGDWEYEDEEGVLMKLENIKDLFTNTLVGDNEKYMTVDVARYGGDSIVFNCWKGLDSYKRVYKSKQGINQTIQDVRDISAEEQIPFSHIIVDEDGVGGGVVDGLSGVRGFVNNSTPLVADTIRRQVQIGMTKTGTRQIANFSSLKDQCGFKLAELVEAHQVRVSDADRYINIGGRDEMERDIITQELQWIKQKDPDKETKLRLIPKSDIKEQIGRSPDVGDTFIMRAWFEIAKTAKKGMPLPGQRPQAGIPKNQMVTNRNRSV